MTPGVSSSRRSILAAMLVMAVFVGGALSGAALDRLLGAGSGPSLLGRTGECPPRRGGDVGRLFDDLELSEPQRQKATAILERRRVEMEAFWRESGPRLRAIVDSTHVELSRILTPQQRERLERLRAERKRRHAGRHGPFEARSPLGGELEKKDHR